MECPACPDCPVYSGNMQGPTAKEIVDEIFPGRNRGVLLSGEYYPIDEYIESCPTVLSSNGEPVGSMQSEIIPVTEQQYYKNLRNYSRYSMVQGNSNSNTNNSNMNNTNMNNSNMNNTNMNNSNMNNTNMNNSNMNNTNTNNSNMNNTNTNNSNMNNSNTNNMNNMNNTNNTNNPNMNNMNNSNTNNSNVIESFVNYFI